MPVINFFGGFLNSLMEARRMQAAWETATYLKDHTNDFKNVSHHDIVRRIIDNK